MEHPFDFQDVTTVTAMISDIKEDVHEIRPLLEDEDGEEETSEDNA